MGIVVFAQLALLSGMAALDLLTSSFCSVALWRARVAMGVAAMIGIRSARQNCGVKEMSLDCAVTEMDVR